MQSNLLQQQFIFSLCIAKWLISTPVGTESVPGAVDRTGGICPFDRKLRSWDSFAGDILVTGET